MRYAKIIDGMKVSKSGVESLSQGHLTWESLGVQDGFEDGPAAQKNQIRFQKDPKNG